MGPLRPYFPKLTSQMSWLRQASARVREWSARQEEKKEGRGGWGKARKKEGGVGGGRTKNQGGVGGVGDDVIEK